MKKLFFILILFIFCCYLFAASSKSYSILSRYSVKDNATGLIWTRCSIGNDNKPIYDFNCNGEKKKFTLTEAIDVCENLKLDGRSDWRLPSIKELQSTIVYYDYSTEFVNTAAINPAVFPNTVTTNEFIALADCFDIFREDETHDCSPWAIDYWSSTFHGNNSFFGWYADYFFGGVLFTFSGRPKHVRCVAGP